MTQVPRVVVLALAAVVFGGAVPTLGAFQIVPSCGEVTTGDPFTLIFDGTSPDATGYRIYVGVTRLGGDIPLGPSLTGVTVPGLTPPAVGVHTLTVTAFNLAGESVRTGSCTLTVVALPLPPPTNPPGTIGLTVAGTLLDVEDSHFMTGSKVTMGSGAGHVASISVFVGPIDALAVNSAYAVALYSDVAGRPGALIAASSPGVLVANSWNTRPVSATVPMAAATSYWLMFNTNGRTTAVNNLRYNPGAAGAGAWSTGGFPYGTWPATFPTSTLSSAQYSIFATFGGVPSAPTGLRIERIAKSP
jgi:hypothetical protein